MDDVTRSVSDADYYRFNVGDNLNLVTREGLWGLEYIDLDPQS